MSSQRWRAWIAPALACVAMLIAPALSWLLIPRPPVFVLPPAPSAAPVAPAAPARAATPTAHTASPHEVRPARTSTDETAAPAAGVEGVVLDADGHAASGATVTCEDRDPPLAATTDADGRFHLDAEAAGCKAVARRADAFPSDPTTLASGPSNTLRLSRGGGIEGEVADERGAPIATFMVAIESYQGRAGDRAPTGQMRFFKDVRGAFTWDNLPAGSYVLTASTDGRPPVHSRLIEVEAARTSSAGRITLTKGATLSGHIVDATTRRPIAGAVVTLDAVTMTRAQGVMPARSDEQGAYALEGAPEGPFSVRVTHDGYRARVVTGITTFGAATVQRDIELHPIVDGGPTGEDFAGIGAFLQPSPKGVSFGRLVPGGPAEKAGIQPGDVIRRIDGADASSLALVDCMQSLRGPDGSRVTVEVERSGQRVEVTIQRRALTL